MSFLDDKEKMVDFYKLTKDEFLQSYSYLTEKEYNETMDKEMLNIKEKVTNFLKNSEDYEKFNIEYILKDNQNVNETIVMASNYDEMICVDPYSMETMAVADWAYNFDDDIFEELEKGKEISYMRMEVHYSIWMDLGQYYPEDIEHKKGVQKYLKYCKENNITRAVIEKEMNLEKVPNIMKFYKDYRRKER